jgi:hypothetical protein
MVLIVFVIMLLNLGTATMKKVSLGSGGAAVAA